MSKYDENIILKLYIIAEKYSDFFAIHNEVYSLCVKKIMSKGSGTYGMFRPEKELEKYFTYSGKLTMNEKNKDFIYYFDSNQKLRITECYDGSSRLLYSILYNYEDDFVEIIWYSNTRERVVMTGYIEYHDGKLIRFVESGDFRKKVEFDADIKTYKEYLFDVDDEFVIGNFYSTEMFVKDSVWRTTNKMRKI